MTMDKVRSRMTDAMRKGLGEPIIRGEQVEAARQAAHERYRRAWIAAASEREMQLLEALHAVELMLLEDERGPWIPGALAMSALHLIHEGML